MVAGLSPLGTYTASPSSSHNHIKNEENEIKRKEQLSWFDGFLFSVFSHKYVHFFSCNYFATSTSM